MGKKNNFFIKTGFLILSIGIAGISFPFAYGYFSGDLFFLQEIVVANKSEPILSQQFVSPENNLSETPLPDYNVSYVKNRLIIPKAKVDMPVFLGDNSNILWKGGWLFPTTSRPEAGGNSVIFGHRFRYLPPISNTFYNLDKVEIGDEFVFVWNGKEYKYKVSDKKIIEPTDLSVIQPTKDSRITLITCAPLFSTKQRLVVVGTLIENKN